MKRADKEAFVADLEGRVRNAPILYLTDFAGLDVKAMTELRQQLRDSGAEYLVAKNRLLKRVFGDAELELPDVSEHLVGPTGVVFGSDGPVAPAKALTEFAKTHDDLPTFKVGLVDQRVVEAAEFVRLAKLPPKEELLAELAGALQAPLAALVGVLEAKVQETAGLLDALRTKKESEEG